MRRLFGVLAFEVAEPRLAAGERGDAEIYAAARKRLPP